MTYISSMTNAQTTARRNELAEQIEALCAESARLYPIGEGDDEIEARIDELTAEYQNLS